MDVDTHIMSIEKETSQEREVGMKTNQTMFTAASSTVTKRRKADPYA